MDLSRTQLFLLPKSFLAPALPANAIPVPITAQTSTYSCGAASVTAVLRYFQLYDGSEKALRRPLKVDPQEGTDLSEMVELLLKVGLDARHEVGVSMGRLMAAMSPVCVPIVLFQAWPTTKNADLAQECKHGHYAVMIGFDAAHFYFVDPALSGGAYGYIPHFEFVRRWHGMGDSYECEERQVVWVRGRNPLPGPPTAASIARID